MIAVNLVPAEILAKARQRRLALQSAVMGGLLALLVVVVSVAHWAGLHRLRGDYASKQAKLKALAAIVAQVEELGKASAAVRARLSVIDNLLKGRALYPIFLSQFARMAPSGVVVAQLTTTTQANGGLKLAISARALSNPDIASWLRILQADSHFSGVELGPVSSSGASGAVQYSFSLEANYTAPL